MQKTQRVSLTSVVCKSANQLSTEMEHETVLMSIALGSYFNLDAIGTDIWKRLDTPVQVSALCLALGNDYRASIETIQTDVLALLEQLKIKGLIEVSPAESSSQ